MHALENHEALTAEQSLPAVPLYRPTYTPSQLAAIEHQRKFRRSLRRVITITIKPPQPVGDDSFGPIVYPEKPPVPPAFIIHVIQETVAAQYGISRQGLSSDHRYQHLIEPRHVAMYLVKTMTNRSLPAVGRLFGGRHHTTVMNAMWKIGNKRKIDPALDAKITELQAKITSRLKLPT